MGTGEGERLMDEADVLREHLTARHPGAWAPWFKRSGYLAQMGPEQLERLHLELVHQGEDCEGRMFAAEIPTSVGEGGRLRTCA